VNAGAQISVGQKRDAPGAAFAPTETKITLFAEVSGSAELEVEARIARAFGAEAKGRIEVDLGFFPGADPLAGEIKPTAATLKLSAAAKAKGFNPDVLRGISELPGAVERVQQALASMSGGGGNGAAPVNRAPTKGGVPTPALKGPEDATLEIKGSRKISDLDRLYDAVRSYLTPGPNGDVSHISAQGFMAKVKSVWDTLPVTSGYKITLTESQTYGATLGAEANAEGMTLAGEIGVSAAHTVEHEIYTHGQVED
jgi:hypothetical protein